MNMMYAAVFTPTSTNTPQAHVFEEFGHTLTKYDIKEKLITNKNSSERDTDLIEMCKTVTPDFLLISKGAGLDIRVIEECKKVCPIVLWYMDPMINVDEELFQKIHKSDYVFYAAPAVYKKLKNENPNSYFIHEGYDSTVHKFYDKIDYVYDTSFIGVLKEHRAQYYNHFNFNCFTDKFNHDHNRIVNQTRININFTNNREGTSDRAYKIMGSGGFLLTEPWEDLQKDFIPGTEVAVFNDEKEFKEKITYYLNNWMERKNIARNGYNKVKKFTVKNWAKFIIERVQK